ncbi:MAG: acyl-CoA dehydrogenase family protein [Actinomycetota bacterium]|nr:acyl-CoA dehydrogenase family protein [Actinomycetota bacterium]
MTEPDSAVTFDPAVLGRFLDGEYHEARQSVRQMMVAYAKLMRESIGLPTADYRRRVREVVRENAAAGTTGLGFPKEYGGGGNVGASIASFETLAFSDLSVLVKMGVQFGLFGGAVLHLGTEQHHRRYLPDVISGRLLGAFAMTETGHGSNVQALETTATYDAGTREFVVHTPVESARKDYIGNAADDGRMAVVFAQLHVDGTSHGVHALLVPLRDEDGQVVPGVRVEDCGHKIGLNGVDNGRIWFDQVRVPRENLLNRYGDVDDDGHYTSPIDNDSRRFFTMLGTLVQGRVSVGGAGLGASKVALTIATRYALRRRQFGPPGGDVEAVLMAYRAHQRRLLPLLARTYALHFAQERLVERLHRVFSQESDGPEEERRELETVAAGTKALHTWHATEAIQTCREACGGAGYLSANRFAALKADTDVFTTFEGDNTVLLQLVAKGLLTEFRDEFREMNSLGVARFVASQAAEQVAEKTSLWQVLERVRDVVPSSDDDGGLLDREYQLAMLRWRADHVRAGVARRLKRGIDRGDDEFEVFADAQDHVVLAARAYMEAVVLEAFADAVARCPEGPERAVLDELCHLHALAMIEAERGWFQEHGRLSGERAKAVTAAVGRLCESLRHQAEGLVAAFGIPEELLDVELL